MAYVTTYAYPKRQDSGHKQNGIRKNNHITPTKRRLFHIICGFCIGLIIAYTVSPRNHYPLKMCRPTYPLSWAADGDEPADIISTDTTNNSLLFVGVMTAQKYLDTRAPAVYRTWGKEIPGKVAFFSSAVSVKPKDYPDLPLVALKGVDDSYPPQKKSFLMLQYMWEHFGDKYEWFFRADDDLYIRPDKIENFLRSIDSSKPHFIGQAGRGKQEEFGLLSLEYDENFCMGGPGIIMSRETLRRVAPHVKYCLQNLYTTHEDVELGRCVHKFAQIPCTWSYEMQSIFYHNSSGNEAFTGNLKTKEVHRAITLHPIKQHRHMYRIHNYMQSLKIHELQQRKIGLFRDLRLMETLTKSLPDYERFKSIIVSQNESSLFQESNLFGLSPDLNKYKPRNEDDIFPWEMISRSLFSHANSNPRRKIESHLKEGLDDVIREVMDNINLFSRERGRVIEFQQILYGYHRLNPLYGPDYILDVLLTFKKYRGRKMTVPVRRHAYIQQQFTGLEIREIFETREITQNVAKENNQVTRDNVVSLKGGEYPNANEGVPNKQINFILPLYKRSSAFVRFINTYEEVCLKRKENVTLSIILFHDQDDNTLSETQKIVEYLQNSYPSSKLKIIPVMEKFARAKALDIGMTQVNMDDLLLFIDVDMIWSSAALQRIRLNTIKNKVAHFPIVFSEYDPNVVYGQLSSPNHMNISEESGYWRLFGFGIMSAYKEDIIKVGSFDSSIVGWGKEDVDLFEKFVLTSTNISVFRSVDPHLVHIFHIVDCDPNLDIARLTMCRNTRTETFGSVNQLANLIYKNKDKIR
ncbi:chondroitin sulfate synthase 1-like [Planococcus citri]|uniref:chondroitin sulfate synthase 1-like n=1 Tax=Planococcus citri TaxID=170843 RepID=UPI0031F8E233